MNLETLIRQAKPKYIQTDSEKVAASVLESLQEPPKTNNAGVRAMISSFTGRFARPMKHRARKVGIIIAATAAAGLCIIGSGFVFPAMANALNQLPIIGSLFEKAGDTGLKTATRQGLITNVNASVTHDGVTFSISDFMYDGIRFSMVLTRETSDGKNEPLKEWSDRAMEENIESIKKGEVGSDIIQVLANGQKLNVRRGLSSDILHNNSSILTIEPDIDYTHTHSFDLPDEFKLDVIVRDAKIKQDFILTFPVTKTTRNHIVVTSEEVKSYDDFNMNIKKIEITEATMLMEVNLSGKAGQDLEEFGDSLEYEVLNENGMPATMLGGSSGRGTGTGDTSYLNAVEFEPFPTLPKSILVKPFIRSDKEKIYIPKLEFSLPVNK